MVKGEEALFKLSEDMRDLQFLEELEKNPTISQRELARKFNIALGVTNACIKKLARKGWVKIRGLNHRQIYYHLTSEGLATTFISSHLFVDQPRWHKVRRVSEFLFHHSRLVINYIPKYHPELNFQEILWRTMRYEETTNTYYETLDELVVSVFKRSRCWKPKKILSLCHLI